VVSKKTDFDLDPEDRHPNSTVRYMIMERGKMTLFQYMKLLDLNEDKAFRFRSALKAGVQLLKHLRVLHDAGIVHGDIHLANVVVNHNGEVK
jgi:serine/threonine protein kinase